MILEYSRQILDKYRNVKFYENPSKGDELFHTDRRTDRHTDMTKLVVAFGNISNTPKNL